MGNRLSKTDKINGIIHGNETYSYDKANMILSRGSIAYTSDLNGNITDEENGTVVIRHNTWDTQNRLRECVYNGTTTTIFTYGADGLRRSMKVGNNPAVHYLLNGQSVAQEGHLDGSSVFTPDVTYFSGIRGPECRYDHNSEKTIWYVYDGLGSVVGELKSDGIAPSGDYAYAEVTATRKFDVYGLPRAGGTGTSATNHGFVGSLGHTSEAETGGLIYMRARWMDPEIGRFISEDPAGDGVNWFVYCQNNPVNLVDGDGRAIQAVVAAAIFAAGVGGAMYLGIGVGYMLAVNLIHRDDPRYRASPNWLIRGAISIATGAVGFMASPKGALWGTGIGAGALASGMAPWVAVAFVVGLQIGFIEACLDYLLVADNVPNYQLSSPGEKN